MPYSTERRAFILSTPLGEDELLIQSFEGTEHLSQLYEFKFELLSERDDIKPADLVGKRVTLRVETADDERHWSGVVASFGRTGTQRVGGAGDSRDMTVYAATMVPWLWQLGLNEDCRIFHDKSIPDIVEAIFGEFEFKDYELQLSGNYPPLSYCTQYRETTFNFVARLLERAGIYWFFRHEAEAEKLVLVDSKSGNPALEPASIRFSQQPEHEDDDVVTALTRRELIRAGRIAVSDFDFEKPAANLLATVNSLVHIGDNSNFERFIFPGGYTEQGDGDTLARLLMEVEEASHETLAGTSNARLFTPGFTFDLEDHPDDALNQCYLTVGVHHHGRNNLAGAEESQGSDYGNEFTAMPNDVPYRAPLASARPRVYGTQTGIVVGPAGEEIATDRFGRVQVLLPWDRGMQTTCWARVMQASAGNGWGTFFVPRVGMEVVVIFENGDPDHPLVIGCVYNGANAPPYALPGEATKSTIKTNSSKGGSGFNELRFEDKAGDEEIFLHAQKKLEVRVEDDSTENIGGNRNLTIDKDRVEHVKGDAHLTVDKKRMVSVSEDDNLDVNRNLSVHAGSNLGLDAGMGLAMKAGTGIDAKAGTNFVLEAGVQVSLKAGPSSITLGPAGVTIDGPLVRINCGGSPMSAAAPEKPDAAKSALDAIEVAAGKTIDPAQQTQAQALMKAARAALPFCAECAAG